MLTEFLLARIAEDEAVAVDCKMVPMGYAWRTISWLHGANREHGRRWSPERVLAECEAKRRMIQIHNPRVYDDGVAFCNFCVDYESYETYEIPSQVSPCESLRLLALPYADHPDFDTSWALETTRL